MRLAMALGLLLALVTADAVRAEVIELKSGEKLEGEVISREDGVVVMEHPTFGRLEIPEEQIKKKKVRRGLFGTSFLKGWRKNIQAGVNGSRGKSQDTRINVAAQLRNDTERSRDQFEARYFLAKDDESTSDNQFRTTYVHDFLAPGRRWFPFIGGIYHWDGEQDWDHRLNGNSGIGYDFIKRDDLEVRGRAGLGVTQTWGDNRKRALIPDPDDPGPDPPLVRKGPKSGDNPENTDFSGIFRLSLRWNIVEGIRFTASHTYFPVFQDYPDFRNRSEAEMRFKVGYIEGLSLGFGGIFDYDSTVKGQEQKDGKYFANLVYDF